MRVQQWNYRYKSSGKQQFDVFEGRCIRAGLSCILLGKMKLLNPVETLILQHHIEAISKLLASNMIINGNQSVDSRWMCKVDSRWSVCRILKGFMNVHEVQPAAVCHRQNNAEVHCVGKVLQNCLNAHIEP